VILFVVVAVFVATGLAALAVFWWAESREEPLVERLRGIASPTENGHEAPAAPARSAAGRFLERLRLKVPGEKELAAVVAGERMTGARQLLCQAGYRSPLAPKIYWGVRLCLPAVLALLGVGCGIAAGLSNARILVLTLAGAAAGVLLPDAFLRTRVRRRQEEITDSLPDAVDLLVVCVEAGLGLNAAFLKITEEFRLSSRALSEEFDVVNREIVAGKPRAEALRALADRTGVEDLRSLTAMLVQTEKLGTSLSQSLRVHSDSMRTKRRQRAEEAAAKTTIKLVFPLVFLLFPALFIVILGPGAIQILRVLAPIATSGR